jgi:hypothetical protein
MRSSSVGAPIPSTPPKQIRKTKKFAKDIEGDDEDFYSRSIKNNQEVYMSESLKLESFNATKCSGFTR